MPLNHTFSLTMCNTKLIIKLTVLIAALILIAFAVLATTVMPVLSELVDIISSTHVTAEDFINHPFVTLRTQIIDKCIDYLRQTDWKSTIGVVIAVYCCMRFFLTVPQLPLTKVIYNKMSTGYDIGLFNAFIATGFQNLLLSLILSLITSAINLGLIAAFVSLVSVSFKASAYIAIPFIIILFIAAYSAKSCLLSQWLPEVCASSAKNIFIGMKNAVKGTLMKFRKNFLCYFTLNAIWVAIISVTFLPTFGAIPLIGIPVFMVMRAILSVTLNFSYHRKKYFIDNGTTVYTPEKLF